VSPRLVLTEDDRNPTYMDWWSVTHIAWGIVLVLLFGPFWALVLMVLWEPFEILVASPIAARFGLEFGHETLRNSLMDIVFDVIGVLVGLLLLRYFGGPWLVGF
jgi:hypothetical protein